MKSIGPKTLVYPAPVFVVGTYDARGKPNAMTAAWGGICCSSPPCVAVSLRKAAYTYSNILSKKAFTINIPSENHVREVDYFGLVSGKNEDKFEKTRLTPVRSDKVDAPYIKEFALALECRLFDVISIGLHTQFIGEIVDVKASEMMMAGERFLGIEKVRPIIFAPESGDYYALGEFLAKAYNVGKKV